MPKPNLGLIQDKELREELEGFSLYEGTDIISSPGKFEESCLYIPYFYHAFMNGHFDYEYPGRADLGFKINKQDKVIFPSLRRRRVVRLCFYNDGSVGEY